MRWQIQTAKNKFSEVVREAQRGIPQLVTKNGQPAVYVVDYAQFQKQARSRGHDKKSVLFARPHKDVEIAAERDQDYGREVDV
jgi:prevent-host-death family protein